MLNEPENEGVVVVFKFISMSFRDLCILAKAHIYATLPASCLYRCLLSHSYWLVLGMLTESPLFTLDLIHVHQRTKHRVLPTVGALEILQNECHLLQNTKA